MKTQAISKFTEKVPALFEELIKPWNELFENRLFTKELKVPAVNITEHKDHYLVAMSAPGLKKEDFKIDVDGDVLAISSQKEESREEVDVKYTRKEYNYTSFSRSFNLPEGVDKEKIVAKYEDGMLKITVPYNHKIKSPSAQHIAVN